MSRLLGLGHSLRSLLRPRAADRETRDEIAFHIECQTERFVAAGMTASEARRRAVFAFGGAESWREVTGDARPSRVVEGLLYDLRHAVRSLRRRPGFVAGVVVPLSLGIGANTAIFSLISAVLLHPVPVPEPERLVAVFNASNAGQPAGKFPVPAYRDLAAEARQLEGLAAVAHFEIAFEVADGAERVRAALVSGSYFPVLGIAPLAGRLLGPADEGAPGTGANIVLSHGLWTRRFGRDPAIVGSTVRLAGYPFTVVGVAPASFRGTDLTAAPELWVPLTMNAQLSLGGIFSRPELLDNRVVPIVNVIGRLRADATVESAATELEMLLGRIETQHPGQRTTRPAPSPARISVLRIQEAAALADRASLLRFVRILGGTVLLTLLLACVSVTNLLLVRAGERTRELGVRSALGAGVRRLRRLLLLESALLALVAGALGAVVGLVTIRLLTSFTLPGGVVLDRAGLALDARALTFTAVLSMLTALAFGLLPAVHAARQDAAAVLRQGAGRTSGPRPRALFVTAQVAISLVLLTGATLFLRSVNVGLSTDLGFDPDPLVALDVHPRLVNYGSRTLPFYEEAVARVSALPGVTAAAATSHLPLQRATILPFSEVPPPPDAGGPGLGVASSGDTREIGIGAVSPGYFATIGVRMVDGRGFASTDRADTEKVVVLNRAAATLFWPGRSAIRQRLYLLGTSYTVVGVVENTKYSSLADSEVPFAYTALAQESLGRATLVARTVDRVQVLEGLQREVREVGPGVPITDPRFVRAQIDTALMPQRFAATLLSIFGAVALCIAAVGLYASVAYAAVSRTAEIGIRLALGAQRSNIVWLLLRHAGAALLVGMLIGVPCALLAAHALRHFLFGIGTRDPASLASAAAVLVLGGMICSVLPAVRAARANALRLLRVDE